MSAPATAPAVVHVVPPPKRLAFFERYLTVWVILCMVVGVALGKALPEVTAALSKLEFGRGSQVNVPIGVLLWLMIYPMMLKVDFSAIGGIARKPKGLLVTLFVNWLVKPFGMALLAWVFMQHVFAAWIDPETAKGYTAGLIILAAAPGALIGASNFFELAVAVAITLFGADSPAALATVVGVLVEVPVMLSVCNVCIRTPGWFQAPTRNATNSNQPAN